MSESKLTYTGYLLVHFIGEQPDGEQVYFSYSENGLHWKDLNGGLPVLRSELGEKGARDPFIVRSPKEGKFYLIATDLRIASGKGWGAAVEEGSRDIIVWESADLVNWSEPWPVTVGVEGAGCVWAPEAIYDEAADEFLVFWASATQEPHENARKHKIYSARTKDFRTFSPAEKYIERENHIIDTTIIEANGKYYRYSKDETTKNIRVEEGASLDKDAFSYVDAPVLEAIMGVEGPEIFKLNGREEWCLIVDRYAEGKGYLPLLTSDLSSGEFRVLEDGEFDLGSSKKRHGGVLPITFEESSLLLQAFGDGHQVLPGQFADPDLAKFGGRYYLYPTTDGFTGWSGTQFHVFSSEDLQLWKDEGVILDLATDDVPWAVSSAWAPCIATKDGRYYYYFCGKKPDGDSAIGVAVADTPIGPFTAQPEPLITLEQIKRLGLVMGQAIDPSIYVEEDGKVYLLFGNSHAAIVELGADMVTVLEDTMQNLEGLHDFREAVTVLKRDGLYHFTWSCDDTGSEDYHVNYGTSEQLYGPVNFQYTVLSKNKDKNMLGTAHHSILQDPDSGKYWIAYHRFVTPLTRFNDYKGIHRETCIDLLSFGGDGLMQPVKL
ncbi:glycosyl hydrolase family 43 [Paenibacillus sp. FSL R7-0273]|uniref:family 43 glycosylhydrolase n=1 Tax=Paenibacillus sp. FSL R7-0273 TaxID=1536772 RepID=UPI0004F6E248|nr:family 43 glycosylhydrolase [Paenibacillus sp. FSL R7-0273]AIQ45841.1 glycosyl hydrolase family 43 [Paenibacillus sp. FSL R7-0273]OMF95370.1 glycosyl hydrolase family 43 [Paenibacillus sp. FSL R7-0273]